MKHNFQVGDKVIINKHIKSIYQKHALTEQRKKCNKIGIIKRVYNKNLHSYHDGFNYCNAYSIEFEDGNTIFTWFEKDFTLYKKANKVYNIKHIIKDKTTKVILFDENNKYINKGESVCHHEDEFNEQIGFDLALARAKGDIDREKELMTRFDVNEVKNIINQDFTNQFKKGNVVLNCETKKEALLFLTELDKNGYTWVFGKKLIDLKYDSYKQYTCYRCSDNKVIGYSDVEFYKDEGYKIIKFKDVIENDNIQNKSIQEYSNEELIQELQRRFDK